MRAQVAADGLSDIVTLLGAVVEPLPLYREIVGHYRGSFMGLIWSSVNPVLMLAVYTFVFSVVF